MYKQEGKPELYIVTGFIDFRCGIDSICYKLKAIDKNLDLTSNSAFVFMNKQKDKIKILYWGGDGFWLIQHRLEESKYYWLENQNSLEKINYQQLVWLLEGLPYMPKKSEKNVKKDYLF